MSTKPKKIYEYLVSKCETLWPAKKQIFNPYDLARNNEMFLADGFAIGFGPFEEVQKAGCCFGFKQDYTISITKEFKALEHATAKRMTFEQDLMGEAVDLIKNIAADAKLGGNVGKCIFEGAPGIEPVFTESQNFISVSLTFNAEFEESLEP